VRNPILPGLLAAIASFSPMGSPKGDILQSQFCWVQGRYDLTIYYAENIGREDRSESFGELLRISGIDFDDLSCKQNLSAEQRMRLFEDWKRKELEVIDTTFMSDLDS
jgi:hypothetical protein